MLTGWQWARAGRSPVTVARGLGTALDRIDPACVVSWEYGPATWRALAWCRRRRRPLVIFSELTPWSDAALSRPATRACTGCWLRAPTASSSASSQGAERLARARASTADASRWRSRAPTSSRCSGSSAARARRRRRCACSSIGQARAGQESAPAAGRVRRGRLSAARPSSCCTGAGRSRRSCESGPPGSACARTGGRAGGARRPARRVRAGRRARAGQHLRAVRRDDARGRGGGPAASVQPSARAPPATWP